VAGTDPQAMDMVGAALMSIALQEGPGFGCARRMGMHPRSLDGIGVSGCRIDQAKGAFVRPNVVPWSSINRFWVKGAVAASLGRITCR
jgi:hypothetical protein